MQNIRNFCIIAHIDHGKSTLADRFLEITKTIPENKMRSQFLDKMDLERERGITIKLQPIRMTYRPQMNADNKTPIDADEDNLLYKDLIYKIRGAIFSVHNILGSAHKENVYQKALEEEFKKSGLIFEKEKAIDVVYKNKKVGIYRSDFVVEDKIIIEIKALPFLGTNENKQIWHYLKGSKYRLAMLVNFGGKKLDIHRIVYDKIRDNIRENQRINPRSSAFILNLIDTPGHMDFSYEVSRALAACEGAILLVDAQKGIQAQTLTNLHLAQKANLVIIPVINKIDLAGAQPDIVSKQIAEILKIKPNEILKISAKTGQGVRELLQKIIQNIPNPEQNTQDNTALIFDAVFNEYQGVISYVRIFGGEFKPGDKIKFLATRHQAEILEVGYFGTELQKSSKLQTGEIGYIISGIRDIQKSKIGDTLAVIDDNKTLFKPLPGYREPQAKVFASFYCSAGKDVSKLRTAFEKLQLNDSSLLFEPDSSGSFGYGFRCGFLGLLHMEITKERLEREFGLDLIVAHPSPIYKFVDQHGQEQELKNPALLPPDFQEIKELWIRLEIITPLEYLGSIMKLIQNYRSQYVDTKYLEGNKVILLYEFPLSEIITDFYDRLKSASSGFASMNYKIIDWRKGDLQKLEIDIAEKPIDAFSQIVHKDQAQKIGKKIVQKLKELLPRQLFEVKIQARIGSKVIASEKIPALRKDVIAKLYGGDRTRKDKLLKKQVAGKKKMKQLGKVEIPKDLFLKFYKS